MAGNRIVISGTFAQTQKIPAIKGLRQLTGIGLKMAKDSVEQCEFESLSFELSAHYFNDEGDYNLSADIAYLRSTGIDVKMMGNYELYVDQLKEIATAAMLKGDYYVAKNLAAFLEKHF
jgi:hypothetical protein